MSKNRKIIRLTIVIAVFLLIIFTLYGMSDEKAETVNRKCIKNFYIKR